MINKKAIGFQVRIVNNMFMRHMENLALTHGEEAASVSHGWVLGYLCRNKDKDIYQKDLEKEFNLSRATVTKILKLLEERGCIERQSVDFDARLKKIILLEKGIMIHKMSYDDVIMTENLMAKNISKEDLEVFNRVMEQVMKNLSQSGDVDIIKKGRDDVKDIS